MTRRVRDILGRDDGITIVFAVLLVVVLLVMGGVIVSAGYSSYKRAVGDNADERTYQNVASAASYVHDGMARQKGWAVELVQDARGQADGGSISRQLTVTPDASTGGSGDDAEKKPSFAPVTVTVRKVSDGSFDVICFETGNASGTALHFRVGYSEEKTGSGSSEKTEVTLMPSNIQKVGQ